MHDIDTIRMEQETDPEAYSYEGEPELEATLSEAEEEMLAAELLGVASEGELDQFFGKLFKRISKGVSGAGRFLKKNAGPLAGALKGIAKTALPTVGAALGSAIPIPGVGTAVGGMLGNAASSLLEAELEGLNDEDREFEVAKRFVRLAGQAAKAGARRPPTMNRRAASVAAVKDALRRLRAQRVARMRRRSPRGPGGGLSAPMPPAPATGADGIVDDPDDVDSDSSDDVDGVADADTTAGPAPESEYETASPVAGARSGRWVRRGGKIILLGV